MMGQVVALCTGQERGKRKENRPAVRIRAGLGIQGDSHAGTPRPISMLTLEQLAAANTENDLQSGPCDFGENITVANLDTSRIVPGSIIHVGSTILRVVCIGKRRNQPDANGFPEASILARIGIFCEVLRGGKVSVGDEVRIGHIESR